MALELGFKIGASLSNSYFRTFRKLDGKIKGIGTAYKKTNSVVTKETRKFENNMQRMTRSAEEAKNKLGSMKVGAVGFLGGAFAAGKIIGAGFDTEQAAIRLKTVINADDTEAAVGQAITHARNFARTSLASEGDILAINYSLNSAGLGAAVARAGSEIVSKLATVTKGGAEEVGTIVGDSFQNFNKNLAGTDEEKLSRIGNVLLKTQEKFSIKDFNQLGESIKEASAAAIGADIPFSQMAAAVGQLNSAGLKGSQAGTSFKALVGQLIQKQDKLGISIAKNADGTTDFIGTMQSLKKRLDTVGDSTEQLAFLQKNLGQQGGDAAILLTNNIDALGKGYDFVASKNDKLTADYKLFTDSASGQWEMLNQNIGTFGSILGSTVLPAVNSVLTPINLFAGGIGKLVQDMPVIGKILGGAMAVTLTYGAVVASVAAWQWAFNSALIASSNSLVFNAAKIGVHKAVVIGSTVATHAATAGQWLWNAAMTANPIGLVIAGVTAFAGLAYTVYKNWEPIVNWLTEKFSGIGDAISAVGGFFGFGGDESESSRPVIGKTLNSSDESENSSKPSPNQARVKKALSGGGRNSSKSQTFNTSNNITVHQQPGEDAGTFVDRVVDEIGRREQQNLRGALFDY